MLKERLEEEGEITVLGGGFIGLELAGKVAKAGYSVKLIHRSKNLLRLDEELSEKLQEKLEKVGVGFHLEANLLKADKNGVETDKGYLPGGLRSAPSG